MQIQTQPHRKTSLMVAGVLALAAILAVTSAHASDRYSATDHFDADQSVHIVPAQFLPGKEYVLLPGEELILASHRWKRVKREAKRGWEEFKFILPEKPSFKWKDIKRGKIKPRLSPWGGLFKPRCVGERC